MDICKSNRSFNQSLCLPLDFRCIFASSIIFLAISSATFGLMFFLFYHFPRSFGFYYNKYSGTKTIDCPQTPNRILYRTAEYNIRDLLFFVWNKIHPRLQPKEPQIGSLIKYKPIVSYDLLLLKQCVKAFNKPSHFIRCCHTQPAPVRIGWKGPTY